MLRDPIDGFAQASFSLSSEELEQINNVSGCFFCLVSVDSAESILDEKEDDSHWISEVVILGKDSVPPKTTPAVAGISVSRHAVITSQQILDVSGIYGIDSTKESECGICLAEPRNCVILPCRHCCACRTCTLKVDKCPVCRSRVSRLIHLEQDLSRDEVLQRHNKT
jgi:hypothetical protein